MDALPAASVLLPVALGLLGFLEPCAIGAHISFAGTLAGRARAAQMASTALFVAVRTSTMGLVGIVAALAGQSFALTQRSFWLLFGIVYVGLGVAYLTNRAGTFMIRLGSGSAAGPGSRDVVVLGIILGFGIPACAAPLLFAASGAVLGVDSVGKAFLSMSLFGLALSAPLFVLVTVPRTEALLRRVAARGQWLRLCVGWLLVAAGGWGVWFGLFVNPLEWR